MRHPRPTIGAIIAEIIDERSPGEELSCVTRWGGATDLADGQEPCGAVCTAVASARGNSMRKVAPPPGVSLTLTVPR